MQRGANRLRAACFRQLVTRRLIQNGLVLLAMILPVVSMTADQAAAQYSESSQLVNYASADSNAGSEELLLRWVNGRNNAGFSNWMQTADATFYPITFASVPVYLGVSLLSDEVASGDALTFTAGWVATAGSTMLLKRLVGRERPYVRRQDLIIRYTEQELRALGDNSSFPSGHTSMSVFLATYIALESNTPPVRITGGLWATSVAVSRMWNGVHFPTDILAGAIIGSGVAMLSHHFR